MSEAPKAPLHPQLTLLSILTRINAYEADTEGTNFTDTGDVWELLHAIRDEIKPQLTPDQILSAEPKHLYAFDVELRGAIRLEARTEAEARRLIVEQFQAVEVNHSHTYDDREGVMVLTEVSVSSESNELGLFEVDEQDVTEPRAVIGNNDWTADHQKAAQGLGWHIVGGADDGGPMITRYGTLFASQHRACEHVRIWAEKNPLSIEARALRHITEWSRNG